jgi:hypothetical protein
MAALGQVGQEATRHHQCDGHADEAAKPGACRHLPEADQRTAKAGHRPQRPSSPQWPQERQDDEGKVKEVRADHVAPVGRQSEQDQVLNDEGTPDQCRSRREGRLHFTGDCHHGRDHQDRHNRQAQHEHRNFGPLLEPVVCVLVPGH